MLDLNILQSLAKLIEKYVPESKLFDPVGIVDEFAKSITKELDFRREARNALIFRENFKDYKKFIFLMFLRSLQLKKFSLWRKLKV